MDQRRVKIEYEGGAPHLAKVLDADGNLIPNVTHVDLTLDVCELPKAIIHTLAPVIEVTVDAEIHTYCPYCNQEIKQPESAPLQGNDEQKVLANGMTLAQIRKVVHEFYENELKLARYGIGSSL